MGWNWNVDVYLEGVFSPAEHLWHLQRAYEIIDELGWTFTDAIPSTPEVLKDSYVSLTSKFSEDDPKWAYLVYHANFDAYEDKPSQLTTISLSNLKSGPTHRGPSFYSRVLELARSWYSEFSPFYGTSFLDNADVPMPKDVLIRRITQVNFITVLGPEMASSLPEDALNNLIGFEIEDLSDGGLLIWLLPVGEGRSGTLEFGHDLMNVALQELGGT